MEPWLVVQHNNCTVKQSLRQAGRQVLICTPAFTARRQALQHQAAPATPRSRKEHGTRTHSSWAHRRMCKASWALLALGHTHCRDQEPPPKCGTIPGSRLTAPKCGIIPGSRLTVPICSTIPGSRLTVPAQSQAQTHCPKVQYYPRVSTHCPNMQHYPRVSTHCPSRVPGPDTLPQSSTIPGPNSLQVQYYPRVSTHCPNMQHYPRVSTHCPRHSQRSRLTAPKQHHPRPKLTVPDVGQHWVSHTARAQQQGWPRRVRELQVQVVVAQCPCNKKHTAGGFGWSAPAAKPVPLQQKAQCLWQQREPAGRQPQLAQLRRGGGRGGSSRERDQR